MKKENPNKNDDHPTDIKSMDDLPEWIQVYPAPPPAWKLTELRIEKHGGLHHIFFVSPRSDTAKALVTNDNQTWVVDLNVKPPPEPPNNFPMWPDNLYRVKIVDGDNRSDRIWGLKMPAKQHWSYYLSFEYVEDNSETPNDNQNAIRDALEFLMRSAEKMESATVDIEKAGQLLEHVIENAQN